MSNGQSRSSRAKALALGVGAAAAFLITGLAWAEDPYTQAFLPPPAAANPGSIQVAADNASPLPPLTPQLTTGVPQLSPGAAPGQPISQAAIEAIVDQRLKVLGEQEQQAEAQQKAAAAQQCCEVGSDLSAKLSFKDGLFLWVETPCKDFTMHIGGWMQFDNVWWQQSPGTFAARAAKFTPPVGGPVNGPNDGGIGELADGEYFRRIRPFVEGTFWETGEYRLILALENDQASTSGLDEFWVGGHDIPFIGTVRVGHVKTPMGLEGDMTASSRCMTFMERSSYSEAIELNQNFTTGLWLSNNYLDQRATATFALTRPDYKAATGEFFGDGQYAAQARVTALPIYQDEGRQLLHLGLSGGYRNGTANDGGASGSGFTGNTIQLNARPELRDDDPAGGGPTVSTNANSNRMVDTGVMCSDTEYLMGLEMLYIRGPFSFQAEYGWNWVDNTTGVLQTTGATTSKFVAFAAPQDYVFSGGYLQLAYTLTGENRAYDRKYGTLAREYFGKSGPFANAWITRDANGNIISSWGAWEIALRYSYLDLNDGSGTTRIQGGEMQGLAVGLNWYLNNNMNVNFDYAYDYRYNLPAGVFAGSVDGFGCRVQFQF
ncbi:MAG: porin [Thermoguttaceae bacterium]|jgi:phosphate-selective porin OprO/OprP